MRRLLPILLLLSLSGFAQEILRPSTDSNYNTTWNCTGTNQASASFANAHDASGEVTQGSDFADTTDNTGIWKSRVFTSWGSASGTYTSLTLKVRSAADGASDGISGNGRASIAYSTDGGTNWTDIYNSSKIGTGIIHNDTTDSITLSVGQNLANLQVRACYRAVGTAAPLGYSTNLTIWDIRTEGVLLTAPSAPTNLSATTISPLQINLAWTDNATNESDYRVERCTGSGCSGFSQINSIAADSVSYSDTPLTPSTLYRYRVRACNAAGCSSYSAIAETTTLDTGRRAQVIN